MPSCWKRCQSKYRTYHVHFVNVTSATKLYNIVLSSLCFQNIFIPLENYATIKHSVHIASKPRSLLTSDFVSVSLSILQFIQEGSYNVFPLCACFSLSTCFLSQLVLQHISKLHSLKSGSDCYMWTFVLFILLGYYKHYNECWHTSSI